MLFHALVEGVDQWLRQILGKGPLASRDNHIDWHAGDDASLDFRRNVLVVDAYERVRVTGLIQHVKRVA